MKVPEYCLIRVNATMIDGQTIECSTRAAWVCGRISTWIAHALWRRSDKETTS